MIRTVSLQICEIDSRFFQICFVNRGNLNGTECSKFLLPPLKSPVSSISCIYIIRFPKIASNLLLWTNRVMKIHNRKTKIQSDLTGSFSNTVMQIYRSQLKVCTGQTQDSSLKQFLQFRSFGKKLIWFTCKALYFPSTFQGQLSLDILPPS